MAKTSSTYRKGRRSLSNAPGGGNFAEKWHQKLDYLEQPKKGKKEIRIVGGVFTIFQHFIRFKRKDGSKGGFYEVCPDFNMETGEFRKGPDAHCPLCADFQDADLPQELRLLGSFRYYMDAFDITAAKNGQKEGVFGVIFANKYGKNDLAMIGDILGSDIDDPKHGTTIIWNVNEKATDPKDRVRFYQGKPLPILYDEDKDLYLLKGGGLRFTGAPTPFDEVVDVRSPEEIRADLKRLGLYARLEEVLEVVASRGHAGPDSGGGGTAEDDDSASSGWGDDDGDDNEEEAPPPKKSRGKKAPAKEVTAKGKKKKKAPPVEEDDAEEDDSWGDDDADSEGVEEAPADDWGDDDDSSDDSDAGDDDSDGWEDEEPEYDDSTLEEEEEEEKPVVRKKGKGKKPPVADKKTVKKKAPPKAAPVDDDDDDDDDPDAW